MTRRIILPLLLLVSTALCPVSAAAGSLPPLDRDWLTFSTAHFHFYFHRETEALARRLAPLAEEIHERLVRDLGMAPRERTHVLVYDDTDQYNAMAAVFPRNTIHVFAASQYAGDQGRIGDWLAEVFAHEYTHILQLGYVSDLPEAINTLLGGVLFPNVYLPSWCTEGLAIAMESALFPSGRLHSSTWRMYLRADFIAGRILTWPQVTNGIYRWPYENAWYLYGSFFTQYLIDRFGRERVAAFYRATGGDLPYLSFAQCFQAVFGADLETLTADWRRRMAAEFQAEAERISAGGLREGRLVGGYGGSSGHGAFAPGGELYFLRRTYGASTLMRIFPPDGVPEQVASFTGSNPAVSPDGRRLVYGLATPVGRNLFYDLYSMDLKGHRQKRLTRGLRANDPAWSPSGAEIAFIKNEPPNYGLYRMRADGTEIMPIWRPQGLEQAFSPAWSPNGDRIVFARYRPEDGVRLWSVRPDGTGLSPLHNGPALGEEIDPAWSPDGRYVFFAADPTGVFNIYACEPATGRIHRVTNVLTGAYEPAVSPDGRCLAYTGYSAEGYDQYLMALEPSSWQPWESSLTPAAPLPPPPAEGHFYSENTRTGIPARPYSPWPTLAPVMGYALVGVNSEGACDLALALAGSDVLETIAYGLSLETGPSGQGYEAAVDFRLRDFTIRLRSSLENQDYSFEPDRRRRTWALSLYHESYGLLAPDDGFAWELVGYEEAYEWPGGEAERETYRGVGVAAVYDRSTLYRGPVDLVSGCRLGGEYGREKRLETEETETWLIGWGRLYLPAGRSRLELAGSIGRDTLGLLRADLGKGFVPGPQGSLVWDAEASLEFPLSWPESGGSTAPGYIHSINGLCSFFAGQALEPVEETACSLGLGVNLRLQVGFNIPIDVGAMCIYRFEQNDWHLALWYQSYSW